MLAIISPAKKLDFQTKPPINKYTIPDLLEDAKILVDILKNAPIEMLIKLMNISYGLAETNLERYKNWRLPFTLDNAKQALFAFNGDVYAGMQPSDFQEDEIFFAQEHIRILSGLYGLLRPLDLIQPYRLPMGTKLANPRGKDLYAFWGDKITELLNDTLEKYGYDILLNLASNEYFKAINPKKLNAKIVNIVFKENKNGVYRVVSFYAKRARGLMCRYIVKNKITKFDDLKGFNYENYRFDEKQSTDNYLVFLRG